MCLECFEPLWKLCLQYGLGHLFHAAQGRACLQLGEKAKVLGLGALSQAFHRSVRQIADMPPDADSPGGGLDKIAKTDPLDSPEDLIPNGFQCIPSLPKDIPSLRVAVGARLFLSYLVKKLNWEHFFLIARRVFH